MIQYEARRKWRAFCFGRVDLPTNYKSKTMKRGKSLTFFLLLQVIATVISILALFAIMGELIAAAELSAEISVFQAYLTLYSSIALLIFAVICVFGVWHWRIWGYWGLISVYSVHIIIALLTWQPVQIIINLVWLALFYYLTRNKVNLFLWKF